VSAFSPSSRYAKTATSVYIDAQGNAISYLARRFLPPSTRFAQLQLYTVVQGDRLDNLANRFLGDAEQFWKLCDANDAMDPDDLIDVGETLRITLPQGIPAPAGANAK
jgi:nucleoid-associated protein YgaU